MAGEATLKELVAAAKDREGTVLDAAERSAPYSYREFATNCFKAGNLLGHYGVHPGATVTVAVGPKEAPAGDAPDAPERGDDTGIGDAAMGYLDAAEPLLAILGGASVGATVDVTPAEPVESRALVAPAWRSSETAPRCSTLAYGGPPEDPAVAHFEAELWSENPTAPPEPVAATDPALRADGESYSHETLLAVAEDVVADHGLDDTSQVMLSASLTDPGALVAGVLAPLSVGATVALPNGADDGGQTKSTEPALWVVADGGESDSTAVRAGDVTASLRGTDRA
ncbi:hypothetical protein BRD19_10705 [Halobacteriales archaeon SW_7_65_23]|nr:MAG: hypothetical protein BRD19_10705 [Halobacteriales archaeon SW_7_65_23]